jgi:D-alanyl-D-alanine carboxypeptidase
MGGAGGAGSERGAGGSGGAPTACPELEAALQQRLDKARAATNTPGAVQAVITPACGRWVGASGESAPGEPMRPDHVLRLGSVTKTFVAATVLQLASEGALGLDDPLETWVPGFPGGAQITVRQMLSHSSGIFNYTAAPSFSADLEAAPQKVWPPQQLVDIAAANPPYFPPGQGWQYSNTNFILLGMIIESATDSDAAVVLRTRLLDPLALSSTSLDGEEPLAGDLARGYDVARNDVTELFDLSTAWTAGAMVGTAGDTANWALSLYTGTALDEASRREMLESTVETGMPGVRYGLGVLELDASAAGAQTWGHTGDIAGYRTQMFYFPEIESVIVSIINSNRGNPNDLTAPALRLLLGTE